MQPLRDSLINLFDFDTSWEGYTCDYVDGDGVRLMMPPRLPCTHVANLKSITIVGAWTSNRTARRRPDEEDEDN